MADGIEPAAGRADTAAARALSVFPAGSNGEFGLPEALVTVIREGRGCELVDAGGRRFLDFSMGWGSVLVGHACPEVVEAVRAQAARGSNFAYTTEGSLALAEELVRLSPACERVRFCASGSEATMYCLRLARAWRRRAKVLKFEGAYHGAHDVGVASLFPTADPAFPQPEPTGGGHAAAMRETVLVAPFNDAETAERLIAEHADELAAVIVEPLQRCLPPRAGFLQRLREATRRSGVLLVFDEVVTGFRLAYAGAQEYYGVVPDLVAYGKALGGGYPIGAFGGRADVMDMVREDRMGRADYVWSASSLGGNPVSAAAANAALAVLRRDGAYARLHGLGRTLREGMRQVLHDHGEHAQVTGDGPLAQIVFSEREIYDYRSTRSGDAARQRDLMLALFRRGVFLNPMGTKLYLSLAHDEAACGELLEHLGAALAEAR